MHNIVGELIPLCWVESDVLLISRYSCESIDQVWRVSDQGDSYWIVIGVVIGRQDVLIGVIKAHSEGGWGLFFEDREIVHNCKS